MTCRRTFFPAFGELGVIGADAAIELVGPVEVFEAINDEEGSSER